MSTISTARVDLEHPYQAAGIVAILAAFVTLAFTLGVLARCGGGRGVCFDTATHAAGDAGLVAFVLLFVVGVALLAYTGSIASVRTRTREPPAPVVNNILPQPTAAQPPVTNVYPQAAVAPATTVVLAPRP
jgi:hypothetical protein